jgi:integrase
MFRRGASYSVRIYHGGRETWRSLGRDYEEACRKLRALRRDEPVALTRTRVKDAAETWLAGYIANRREPRSAELAKRRAQMYLFPFLGDRLLERVRPNDLREYRVWLESRSGLSPQSICHVLSDARCLFGWAQDEGLIPMSPVPRRLLPRLQEKQPDPLTDEEAAVVAGLHEPFGFLCRLALGTGLRWGEVARAQAADLNQGVLIVPKSKNRKLRRVPVSAELEAEIRLHVGRLCPFSARSSGYVNRTILSRSGVTRFHFHRLRDSFACRWLNAGGSIEALSQAMGHHSVKMTERYGKVSDAYVRAEAGRVHARWAGGP